MAPTKGRLSSANKVKALSAIKHDQQLIINKSNSLSHKYASKYLDEILSDIVKNKTDEVTKHKSTISKWSDKMKLSVLRKVSYASKLAFNQPEYDQNYLETSIAEMKEKIRIREERITSRATTLLKRSPFHDFQSITASNKSFDKKFDDQTKRIGDRFSIIADKIDKIRFELPKRINGLISVITSIDKSKFPKVVGNDMSASTNDNNLDKGDDTDEDGDNYFNESDSNTNTENDIIERFTKFDKHLSKY